MLLPFLFIKLELLCIRVETAVSDPAEVAKGTYELLLNDKGSSTVLPPTEYPHCAFIFRKQPNAHTYNHCHYSNQNMI